MAGQSRKRKADDEDEPRECERKVLKVVDEQDPLQSTKGNRVFVFKKVDTSSVATPESSASSIAPDTVSAAGKMAAPPTVSPSLLDRMTGHRIANLSDSSEEDKGRPDMTELMELMSRLEECVWVREKISEEKLKKITTGTIIWEVTADKTMNPNASVARSDYFPTFDGLYCVKGAPWMVLFKNEEEPSLNCLRMTRHGFDGDSKLTPGQLAQTMRVLYPDGKDNPNVHGLPVVHVQECQDSQAGDRVSLINMEEIRTFRATQDTTIWGQLYPGSAFFFLREYMRRFQAKTEAALEELQAEIDASPAEALPAVERRSGQFELEHGPPSTQSQHACCSEPGPCNCTSDKTAWVPSDKSMVGVRRESI
ncbi:hypothetical protein J4E86_005912 [Alternaria arbusti]|uniref:uncharacterized protein n=1 Tax=Alternaria arbusti TaxID=232088 RepID=UPI002220F196|nr:uncharacterized protein J4E86_005912 [Alternaria arbusti]KAI4954602.1 hypothetical protein J4E86_005912 [Alternaria arbusti]